jgi:hypothetical protein
MSRHPATTPGLLVLACTGALVVSLAAAPISSARSLAARGAETPRTRTLLARETSTKDSKKGFSWAEQLSEGGVKVGQDVGACTFVGTGFKRAACTVTMHLSDGTILLRGTVDLSKLFSLRIAGGTGAYAGAGGTASAKDSGKSKSHILLRFA